MPLAHNQGWLQSVMSEEGGCVLEDAFEVLREFFRKSRGHRPRGDEFCGKILWCHPAEMLCVLRSGGGVAAGGWEVSSPEPSGSTVRTSLKYFVYKPPVRTRFGSSYSAVSLYEDTKCEMNQEALKCFSPVTVICSWIKCNDVQN